MSRNARASSTLAAGTSCCSLTYKEKQIMDTLSFVLGIAFVVVIAVAIVAVYAFVKVKEVKEQINNSEQSFSRDIENVYRTLHEEVSGVYRQMDSRFDKLVTRKQLLKD